MGVGGATEFVNILSKTGLFGFSFFHKLNLGPCPPHAPPEPICSDSNA